MKAVYRKEMRQYFTPSLVMYFWQSSFLSTHFTFCCKIF